MTKAKPHIVSTRILSPDLIDTLTQNGLEVYEHDFIQTQIELPQNISRNKIHQHIVCTSKNSIAAWLMIVDVFKLNKDAHFLYCLEGGSKEKAKQHQLKIAGTAPDATSLAKKIVADQIKVVTFLCGNRRRDELPTILLQNKIKMEEIVVYKTVFNSIKVEGPIDAVLFFSPSGVESFLKLNSNIDVPAFCIGETTAAYATQSGFKKLHIAEQSSSKAVIKSVIDIFKTSNAHA